MIGGPGWVGICIDPKRRAGIRVESVVKELADSCEGLPVKSALAYTASGCMDM